MYLFLPSRVTVRLRSEMTTALSFPTSGSFLNGFVQIVSYTMVAMVDIVFAHPIFELGVLDMVLEGEDGFGSDHPKSG